MKAPPLVRMLRSRAASWRRVSPIRLIAWIEAAKGLVVLLTATGLVSLLHHDLYAIASALLEHAHLNPASRYPQIFLDVASRLQDSHLVLLAIGAFAYSAVRFVEAYGLYFERTWAELLAAASGLVYVPFELFALVRKPTWHGALFLLINLAVVAIMVRALLARRRNRANAG